MMFDTDVLIWAQRGHAKIASLIDATPSRFVSIQTYMELLQGAQNKDQIRLTKVFLRDFDFQVVPLSENIGHRASIYVEAFACSHGMRVGDAIIAATACEATLTLATANGKHFKFIEELDLKILRP